MRHVLAVWLSGFLASSAGAIDLLGGQSVKFRDKPGSTGDSVVAKFKDSAIVAPLPDPLVMASSLRLETDLQDLGTLPLPMANWSSSGSSGFSYKDRSGAAGGVQKVVLRTGSRGGKLQLSLKGETYGAAPLVGPITYIEATLTIGAISYCGRFEVPAPSEARRNQADLVVLKGPSGPCAQATPTLTPADTATPTITETPSVTPTLEATASPTQPEPTATETATETATAVATSTATDTATESPTASATATATSTSTPTSTETPTSTSTSTSTETATATSTPTSTETATATSTPTSTTTPVAITILNAGFEAQVVAAATGVLTTPTNWAIYNPANINGSSDSVGYLNGTGSDHFPNGVPEGTNAALVFMNGPATGEAGLRQTLAAVLQVRRYTLRVAIGNIDSGTSNFGFFNLKGFPGYRVDLLAGTTVIATDNNSLALTIPEGQFRTTTIEVSIPPGHPQLGAALSVRLVNLNIPGTPSEPGIEVNFDDVRLETQPSP